MNERKKQIEMEEDRIVNRILINFGIGIFGYIFLWFLYKTNLSTIHIMISAAVFAAASVICFIVAGVKNKGYLPYGIMFASFTTAMLIIKSSYILSKIVGMERFVDMMKNETLIKLVNASYDLRFVAVCGGIYLFVMLVVNIIMIARLKTAPLSQ